MPQLLYWSGLLLPMLLLFIAAATSHSKRRSYKLPPGPKPLPIIGNLLYLRDFSHISLHNLSKQYGPLMHLKLGQIPTVIASSKESAFEILKTQDLNFCTRSQTSATRLFSYGGLDLGMSAFNDHWKTLRIFANAEIFCTSKVQSFHSVREEEIGFLMSTIRRDSCSGKEINITEMALCLFNNILYRQVFGKRLSNDGECGSSPHHDTLMSAVAVLELVNVADVFPSFWWLDFFIGSTKKADRVFRLLDGIFEKEIEERLESNERDGRMIKAQDLLDLLLLCHIEKHPMIGFLLSRDEIKALFMNLFLGGTVTSSAVVEWGLAELMRNKWAMKKAQDEVREVVGNKGKVEVDDLKRLHYLNLVIKETLRLHNPVPLLGSRKCMRDTEINGFEIPAKTRVFINTRAISRDPQLWENPEVFAPERFENSPITYNGNHFELIPFGSGRRSCPGMAIGIINAGIALANLLYGFEWKMPFGMDAKDMDMNESFGIAVSKKIPLKLAVSIAQV